MKKIIILLILSVGFLSFNEDCINLNNEKLTEAQLSFIMESYDWKSERLLIVNFRQPRTSCHYNNYQNLKKSAKWWTEFYSKMEIANIRNIFVYSDNLKANKVIDSENHFDDINNFFLNKVFTKDKTCYGLIVINKKGEFRKKAGEFMQKDIEEFITQLE
ncbi:hypothetical protein QSV08_05900 [Maribacter sp. BPC-D8]|uniref:hypothetical protein n=1 Tax=Maribacter sp. BPC-D8 TaxID=3053613 RepID=UPI002B47AA96|nr:hypothetical protein [Maribacter sp. BPC-D8]WRI30775.1 hypothetical protein QSV08_05900 [Maribacter sp. BPC-D8]